MPTPDPTFPETAVASTATAEADRGARGLDQTLRQLEEGQPDEDVRGELALFRDALAIAPARLAAAGLFWSADVEASNGVYNLAARHFDLAAREAALETLGDDQLEGWALADDYAEAAYALGVAMGYLFAAGAAPRL